MLHTENIVIYSPGQLALSEFLKCNPSELSTEDSYGHNGMVVFLYGDSEYAAGDDNDADKALIESIKESVWAFNPSFISEFTGLPEDMFKFASEQCESANDAIL